MELAVHVKNLVKKFGDFTAVDHVSFDVKKGEIYGFLGANGAGKTTTIKMLCGLWEPTGGDAWVVDLNVRTHPDQIKKQLGYMSQKFALYNALTVTENMTFFAGLYGLDWKTIKRRIPVVIEQTGLNGFESKLLTDMPGGLKQRVALSCALVHEPKIVFLDEPTAGVDPMLRRKFWEIIDFLSENGTTVFVTTHYMDEVEHCHRIALMSDGKIVKEGTTTSLKEETFPVPLIEIETDTVVEAYNSLLEIEDKIGEVSMYGPNIHVVPAASFDKVSSLIIKNLHAKKLQYSAPKQVQPSMEDVFIKVVKHESNEKQKARKH